MTVTVRFAPSPTGRLHVGNARQALINWLFARAHAGRFILRIDDTDRERSREEYVQQIEADLRWLGLDWDSQVRQSERIALYDAASDRLRAAGRLYPCFETAEELELKRKLALSRGQPPIYDRAALKLGADEIAALEARGRRPHWRFKLSDEPVAWTDLVRVDVRFDSLSMSDPVVIREDGGYLYMLPSVVDDVDLGLTHVIRGEDHVSNTAIQIQMFQALDGTVPTFGHLPMLTEPGGAALSKRKGAAALAEMREAGIEPLALCRYLAGLGGADAAYEAASLDTLAEGFSLQPYGKASAVYMPDELTHLNAHVVHEMPFEAVAQRLQAMGLGSADAAFWGAVRGNLSHVGEAADWHRIVYGDLPTAAEIDPAFRAAAVAALPAEPWDESSFKAWADAVKAATGAKGKALFMPLRLLLTGCDHGPELKHLFPLIGPDRVRRRLAQS